MAQTNIIKTAKQYWYLLIIALVAVLSFSGVFSLVGATPITCTQPKYISTDPYYQNGTFQCTMVASGSGKYLETTLSPADAQNLFGVITNQPAKITVEVLKDNCRYQFNNISYPIYSYAIERQSIGYSNGFYTCSCSMANPACNSATTQAVKGTYVGTSPIKCSVQSCQAGSTVYSGSCDNVWRKQIGVGYKLDPSVAYDFQMRINMTLNNQTYSGTINSQNTSIFTPAFRAELLGQLQGQQSCPANPDVAAFVNSSLSSAPLKYVSAAQLQAVINQGYSIADLTTALSNGDSYNTITSSMLASSPNVGQYASYNFSNTSSLQTAMISIEPTGTVSVPVFNLYINAQSVGIHVPSGQPKIQSVTASPTLAATRAGVNIQVTNLGETDSFDGSVTCGSNPVSPFSSRISVQSNQTVNVSVNTEYAGFIGTCTAEVHSVNSPQKSDSQSVKLTFYPYCARSAPSPAHQMVFTSLGCAFVCPNYGQLDVSTGKPIDVFDASCGVITSYDRCTDYQNGTCTNQASYTGYHCTGDGTYMTMNNYMDAVLHGAQPFIPAQQANKYFIATVDYKPVCKYIDAYGYSNGQPVASLTFDYAAGYPQGTEVLSPVNVSTPVPQQPATPPAGPPAPVTSGAGTPSGGDYTQALLIIGGVVLVAGGYILYISRKPKRK